MKVVLVGLGGTGSHVVNMILQKSVPFEVDHLIIVDFDVVEQHNLSNQPIYSADDVGRPKADVVERLLQPFTNISKQVKHIQEIDLKQIGPDLVVSCVDNVQARQYITSFGLLVLDFGTSGLRGTVRFYGTEFAPFDESIFGGEEAICGGFGAEVTNAIEEIKAKYVYQQRLQELQHMFRLQNITISQRDLLKICGDYQQTSQEMNGFIVARGMALLKKYFDKQHVADMYGIDFREGYFEQEIELKQGGRERVLVTRGRIVFWERFGINTGEEGEEYWI